MKICYIAASIIPSRSANSIHVMKMCQAYASLGHQVTLIVPKWREGAELIEEDVFTFYGVRAKFKIRQVPYRHSRFDTFYFGAVLPLVAFFERPDIIHSRSLAPAWGAASLLRMPTLYELHDVPSHNDGHFALFKRLITSQNLRALVAITQRLAGLVRPLIPDPLRLLIAPDGVDSMQLQKGADAKSARIKLGLNGERRRVAVYTGHLYQGRGIDLIVRLAELLSDHLFLVAGGREADVTRYRELTNGAQNLCFLGFKPPAEVSLYLQAADVLLMPYEEEVYTRAGTNTAAFASPMKMFEYMAAGKPIIASNLSVLQEVLKDGENALLRPAGESHAWQEALKKLQQNPVLAIELGQRARCDAAQYTWEKRAQLILKQCEMTSA